MASLRPGLVTSLLLAGCFNPSDGGGGTETDTDPTAGSTMTSMMTTNGPTAGPGTNTGGSSGGTSTATTTMADDSTGETGAAECGNGTQEGGEECDDGNTESGDGCSGVCLDETVACSPGLAGMFDPDTPVGKMEADDSYVYMIPPGAGALRIIDVADPDLVSVEGSLEREEFDPAFVSVQLVKEGNVLYIGGMDPGLAVVDVSDPSSPGVGFTEDGTQGDGWVAVVNGHLLRSVPLDFETWVYDLSDPLNPAFIGSAARFNTVGGGATLAFNTDTSRVYVTDFSDPATPTEAGEYIHPTAFTPTRIVGTDAVAYVATQEVGVLIVDVSTPAAPDLIATIDGEIGYPDIALRGDFIYLPTPTGLQVYDVSDPADPELAGAYLEVDAFGSSVAVNDTHVFLGADAATIRILEDMPGMCEPRCGNNVVEYPEDCDDGNADNTDACPNNCEDSDE